MRQAATMRLGAHLSIAGGLWKAAERAAEAGCDALQIFTTNPRGWRVTEISDRDAERFRDACRDAGLSPVAAHLPYLPNLGSPDREIYAKSVVMLQANLVLCDRLGIDYLVTHLAKAMDQPPWEARRRLVRALDRVYCRRPWQVTLCLENTAGQGTELGHQIADLGRVIARTAAPERIGLCLDTCHAFAAGYDLRTRPGLDALLGEIDDHLGRDRLKLLHLNDSARDLGTRVDRHANIGRGFLGEETFRHVVNHPRLRGVAGILETPYDTPADVARELGVLRRLQGQPRRGGRAT